MIDFKALMDPEVQAKHRAERQEEERIQKIKDDEIRAMLDTGLDHYETLSERERSFIRSCRTRINSYLALTEAQEKWLRDIAARLSS